MSIIRLYHTGFSEIPHPDIYYGKPNADFGQGFYTSSDPEFCRRWARERRDRDCVLNVYELNTDGLMIKELERDAEWFDYIFNNRAGRKDTLSRYDIIIGPIANDTIYDTWGIITSGLLDREIALKLLRLGGEYRQTAIKTDKAVSQLKWLGSEILDSEEIAALKKTVRAEEAEYQRLVAEALGSELDFLSE